MPEKTVSNVKIPRRYLQDFYTSCLFKTFFAQNRRLINKKLAPYGTDGRLLLTANFKVT